MTQLNSRASSNSSIGNLEALADIPLCIVCEQAAHGVGPFSRHHLCQQHLDIDEEQAVDLQQRVKDELRSYSEGDTAVVIEQEKLELLQQLQEMERRFEELQQKINQYWSQVREQFTARIDAVQKCARDLDDVKSYDREVKEAQSLGNMAEVVDLAVGMQASLPDLAEDFEVAQRLRVEFDQSEAIQRLQQLWRMVQPAMPADSEASAACPSNNNAASDEELRPELVESGAPEAADGAMSDRPSCGEIVMSHELKLEDWVSWVAVCNDTREFRGDKSGRVVSAKSVSDASSVALPQPCLVARVGTKDYLTVLPLTGSVRLRSHCTGVNWSSDIRGLHCDRQLVYVAQEAAVTVMDLSGRIVRRILPEAACLSLIRGIGGNAASAFVSCGNKIAAFSKATGSLETVIAVTQVPHADLRSLAVHRNGTIFVTDWANEQVHAVSIDTKQLVASHPAAAVFKWPRDVAVDSRGRVFVSEFGDHTVRAVAADNGSLLWTLGASGERGSGRDSRLNKPWGLAIVSPGVLNCEQLVIADRHNNRLLMLNLY